MVRGTRQVQKNKWRRGRKAMPNSTRFDCVAVSLLPTHLHYFRTSYQSLRKINVLSLCD
jgi:hypothetical protein